MSFPCGTSLITRGVITCNVVADQTISLDTPEMISALEVRPKIRLVAAPDLSAPVPVTLSAGEVVPSQTAVAEPVTAPADAPHNLAAEEVKPVIIKVEEE